MKLISNDEFSAMERLLADLLPHCDSEEEVALLGLHTRLEAIHASQRELNAARDRLNTIRSQTVR